MLRSFACIAAAALLVSTSVIAAPPTHDVNVVNTPKVNVLSMPAVTISGTPTVTVANQPGPGQLYNEVLGVNGSGIIISPHGSVVPDGMRRTITHVSAHYACSTADGAVVRIHSSVGSIYLPGTLVSPGRWAMSSQLNVPQRPGSAFQLILETSAPNCDVTVFLAGVEVPEQP
jgi:hypothetical protein